MKRRNDFAAFQEERKTHFISDAKTCSQKNHKKFKIAAVESIAGFACGLIGRRLFQRKKSLKRKQKENRKTVSSICIWR